MIFKYQKIIAGSFTISKTGIGMDNFCEQTRYFSTGESTWFGNSHTIDLFFGTEKNQVYVPNEAMK